MSPDRLIYMANQIGKFFQILGHDKAVLGIAEHIKKILGPAHAPSDLCASRLGRYGSRPERA